MTDRHDLTDRSDIDQLTSFVRSDPLLGGVVKSAGFDVNEIVVAREIGFEEGGGLMVLVAPDRSMHVAYYDAAYRLDVDEDQLSDGEVVAGFPEVLVAVEMMRESFPGSG